MLPVEAMNGPLFDGLTSTQVTKLAAWFEPVAFAADAAIFNERERAERLYVVESGEVAIRYRPEDGGDCLTIATVRPGGVCGWSAALGRARYSSAAVCLTDVQALSMRGQDLRTLTRTDPELGGLLLRRLGLAIADRLGGTQTHIIRLLQKALSHPAG